MNTFLLIVEDEHDQKSLEAIKEYERIILSKFEQKEEKMNEMAGKIEF